MCCKKKEKWEYARKRTLIRTYYEIAQKYDKSRGNRETATYNVERSIEERHAKDALVVAQEFIGTIRELINR
jgi:uncharacterized protein (UPF0332 family)